MRASTLCKKLKNLVDASIIGETDLVECPKEHLLSPNVEDAFLLHTEKDVFYIKISKLDIS